MRANCVVLTLVLCACGSDSTDLCRDSCRLVSGCTNGATAGATAGLGWYCPRLEACDTQAACQATCVIQTSCAVVAGADPAGLEALRSCMAACLTTGPVPDIGPGTAEVSIIALDAGPPPPSCVPACQGKACGPDGCGGQCGSCPAGLVCDTAGSCSPAPASCTDECPVEGQKLCTSDVKYRSCVKGFDGCLTWDCST